MTTVLGIVERAFRKIGIKAEDEALTADQAQHGCDTLTMMLAGWRLQGVSISYYPLTLTGNFPLRPEFEEATVYLLASRLSPDYQVPPGFDADDFMRRVQAVNMIVPTSSVEPALRNTTSQRELRGDF